MKKYNSILKYIFVLIAALVITGCVHDDKYDEPNLDNYQCRSASYYTDPANGYEKWTLAQLKSQTASTAITKKAYVEAYVSSSDETGNIYKTLYVQDNPKDPTQGLTISLDAVSLYTKFPQGSKVYLDVQGLAITVYGGVKQLGKITPAGTRVPEKEVNMHVFRDCDMNTRAKIIPKVMTLTDMVSLNDDLIGCLIQINNVEFDGRALCTPYAPNGVTVDKTIGEGWDAVNQKYLKTAVVRNSGYASFANQMIPAGNGSIIAIYSKYNSTYQMYINRVTDLDLEGDKDGDGIDEHFDRLDGVQSNPCQFSANGLTVKTIAEVKQLNTSANWTQITGDFYVKAQITANDATGNLFKYVYLEDATGGLRINMNKNDLFLDNRFRLGKDLYIKLKGLYLRNVSGEIQLGGLYTPPATGLPQFGQIEEPQIYKHFFDTNTLARAVIPTERTISSLTTADVGRWVKFRDLEFIDTDLGKMYAVGTAATNRTLKDCLGNTIVLRTSGQADFGSSEIPKKASATEIDGGKGDVYAIVSIFNGTYQLWITRLTDIDLDNPRCDGSIYTPLPVLYSDDFAAGGFGPDWTTVNVAGPNQFWNTSNQGNGTNYYAVVNGVLNNTNEDWLISKPVSLVGKTKAAVSFTTDVRYSGPALQVFATENYTGNPATTTWVALSPSLDTNTAAFGDWVSSGNVDLAAFLGKNVRIAFKYTSTAAAAATWEVDDFKIKGQ